MKQTTDGAKDAHVTEIAVLTRSSLRGYVSFTVPIGLHAGNRVRPKVGWGPEMELDLAFLHSPA